MSGVRAWCTCGFALATMLSIACTDEAEPRPQWTVELSTDAPLVQFGDRLLVEVLNGDGELACSACRRQFPAARTDNWPMSMGVVPDGLASPLFVRARLFRSSYVGDDGLPAGMLLIDAIGRVPSRTPEGAQPLSLKLHMSCFGRSSLELNTTCDPSTGELAPVEDLPALGEPLQPGSWSPVELAPCPESVPAKMACIPGGAYLFGDFNETNQLTLEPDEDLERLVVVPTYLLDTHEVTVAEVRPLLGQLGGGLLTKDPGEDAAVGCTLDANDTSQDALPINCVSHEFAASYCAAIGKRLPSEAEWEYAAGRRQEEAIYPWGNDGDIETICKRAIVARGTDGDSEAVLTCRALGDLVPPGVQVNGSEDDVTPDGLFNMAGNVSEWMADDFAPMTSDCWFGGPIWRDASPCNSGVQGARKVIRGGTWASFPIVARVSLRAELSFTATNRALGFRCARDL